MSNYPNIEITQHFDVLFNNSGEMISGYAQKNSMAETSRRTNITSGTGEGVRAFPFVISLRVTGSLALRS